MIGSSSTGNSPSRTSNPGAPGIAGGNIFSGSFTCPSGRLSLWIASRLRRASGVTFQGGMTRAVGGRTGASGRGGIFVRGATRGGGLEVGGWPRASRNLRICSASDSVGPCRIGGGISGADDVDVSSDRSLFALPAALVSNWNKSATAISKRNSRFSKWAAITFCALLNRCTVTSIHKSAFSIHMLSLCGLSPSRFNVATLNLLQNEGCDQLKKVPSDERSPEPDFRYLSKAIAVRSCANAK